MSFRITIPIIILIICCIILASQHFYTEARQAAFESNRARYMSDILRITEGVSPVLWIDPQYSYISNAKYFDLSGNENHALQSNATYQPTVKPPGLYFDGTDDYVNCGTNTILDIIGPITIEVRVKPNGTGTQGLFTRYNFHSTGYELYLYEATNKVYYYTHQTGVKQPTYTSDGIGTGAWKHIAVVRSGATATIYVDGTVPAQTHGTHIDPGSNPSDIADIASRRASLNCFNGTIDEVRIWDTALSASQIQALYLAGLSKHRQ